MTDLITWNPNDKSNLMGLENNHLTAYPLSGNSNFRGARSTKIIENGKWYFELSIKDMSGYVHFGIANKNASLNSGTSVNVNQRSIRFGSSISNGQKVGLKIESYGDKIENDDILGVAVNKTDGCIEFFKNGTSMGVAFDDISDLLGDIYVFLETTLGGSPKYTVNFGVNKFNIVTENPSAWWNLLGEGYKPYDIDNAEWFQPINHLIKQGNDYYTTNNNYYKLGEPTDKTELKKWLAEYGASNILNLQDSYDNKIVPVDKFSEPRKIYESLDVDFNDIKKPYIYAFEEDDKKKVRYDTDSYKIIDEIKKINNGVGNVVFKEH